MFQTTSMTGWGVLVLVITTILSMFGIVPQDGQIVQILNDIAVVVGWTLTIWGQIRRTDLTVGFLRK